MILNEGSWFAPVIEGDHEDAFITERMYESLEKGNFNKVPLMLGMMSEEAVGQAGGKYTRYLCSIYELRKNYRSIYLIDKYRNQSIIFASLRNRNFCKYRKCFEQNSNQKQSLIYFYIKELLT